jgi:hypothetical protein
MTLRIYIDRTTNSLVKGKADATPYVLPPLYYASMFILEVFVLEPNPTGGLSNPYNVVNVTAQNLRVGIGDPAGASTPIAQTLSFSTATEGADVYFFGFFSLNTIEVRDFIAALQERETYLEAEISSDGSTWDKLIQTGVRVRATLFDGTPTPVVGPVQSAVFADSPVTVNENARTLLCEPSGGAMTVNLPQGPEGRRLLIKDTSGYSATNAITISPGSNDLENGSLASIVLNKAFEWVELVYAGGNWGRCSAMASGGGFSPYEARFYV